MILPLEQQVTNLELSRQLCELGVPQESFWAWSRPLHASLNDKFKLYERKPIENYANAETYAAYTPAELTEIMPHESPFCSLSTPYYLRISKSSKIIPYVVGYGFTEMDDKKLTDALAKMLIWLAENGYVKFKIKK